MIVLTNTTYNKTELSLFTSRRDFRRWPVASQLNSQQLSATQFQRQSETKKTKLARVLCGHSKKIRSHPFRLDVGGSDSRTRERKKIGMGLGSAGGRDELLSYGCTDSSLPPTDLGCAGHGDQKGGWGCHASLYIEARADLPSANTLHRACPTSTSSAACPGQSPVTPPDRVLSPPCETDTI